MEKSFKRKCIEFFARRGQKLDALAANNYTVLMLIHWTWPATLASIPGYIISYFVARSYYDGTYYNSSSTITLFGMLGAAIIWAVVFFSDFILSWYCQSILKKEEEQEKQRTQKLASELGRKIKFYHECKANGVSDITDTYDQKKAELIAQRLDCRYSDIEQYYREAEIAATQKR